MSESPFNLTLPGGVPAIDMGDGYAMADPTLDLYDASQLAFMRARTYALAYGEPVVGIPASTGDFENSRDEMAAMYAVAARDRFIIEACLWHQEDGKWSLVYKPGLTRSQQPKLPTSISDTLNQTVWKVLAASEDPFVS